MFDPIRSAPKPANRDRRPRRKLSAGVSLEALEARQVMTSMVDLAHLAPPIAHVAPAAPAAPPVHASGPTTTGLPTTPALNLSAGSYIQQDTVQFVNVAGYHYGFAITNYDVVAYITPASNGWQTYAGTDAYKIKPVAVGNEIRLYAIGADGGLWVQPMSVSRGFISNEGGWLRFGIGGGGIQDYRVAVNADGRQEVFTISRDGTLSTSLQRTAGSADYLAPGTFSGGPYAQVEVVNRPDGRIGVFALDRAGTVKYAVQTSPSVGSFAWRTTFPTFSTSLFPVKVQSIAAGVGLNGDVELFAVDLNNNAFHRGTLYRAVETSPNSGSFTGWVTTGATARSVAVARNQDGRLEVFASGLDGNVRTQTENYFGTWGPSWVGFNAVPDGVFVGGLTTRIEDGVVIVQAIGYSSADNSTETWETRQSTPNRSDYGWADWKFLAGQAVIH